MNFSHEARIGCWGGSRPDAVFVFTRDRSGASERGRLKPRLKGLRPQNLPAQVPRAYVQLEA